MTANPIPQGNGLLLRLLGHMVRHDQDYGLLGDLQELYAHRLQNGRLGADLWLLGHLLRLAPARIREKIFWAGVMAHNYGKLGFRNLAKDRLSTAINIAGLSVAVGVSLLSFLFIDFYYTRDTNHVHGKDIFLVGNVIEDRASRQLWGDSPEPLGPALAADFPQVCRAVRVADARGIVRYEDRVFHESIRFVDDGFLDLFTYPLKFGAKAALNDPSNLILSEEMAEKYFGRINPVGEQLAIQFANGAKATFLVGGVAEAFDKRASFWFDILIPYEKQVELGLSGAPDWGKLVRATFIQMNPGQSPDAIQPALDRYLALQNAASPDRPMQAFKIEPLLQMSRDAYKTRQTLVWVELYPGQLYSMAFGGLFILLQACFNYMNMAIVASTRRFKEIAVRKIMGSAQRQLVVQFLGENLVLCLLALVVGLALGAAFIVPGFNALWGVFHFDVNILGNGRLLLFLLGVLLLTGVVSGLYPAFYVSAFQPVNILRKKYRVRGTPLLVQVLLTIQFVCAIHSVSSGVVFSQNSHYQRTRDWGYDAAGRLVIPVESEEQYVQMRDLARAESDVLQTAGAATPIGWSTHRIGAQVLEETHDVIGFEVGSGYVETLGLRLASGRAFLPDSRRDEDESLLVNETFARSMGWTEPLGQKVTVQGRSLTVVGVVKDFHYDTFMHKVEPVLFLMAPEAGFRYLAVQVQPGRGHVVMERLRTLWQARFPDSPFMGYHQDEVFDNYYRAMAAVAKSSSAMALAGLLITCMGILGLVSMDIARRMKEISIRKVLGAGRLKVALRVNRGFFRLILLATVMAVPSGYFLFNLFLDSLWKYHRRLDLTPFLLALAVVAAAAGLTVLSKIQKALVSNPIHFLREE